MKSMQVHLITHRPLSILESESDSDNDEAGPVAVTWAWAFYTSNIKYQYIIKT